MIPTAKVTPRSISTATALRPPAWLDMRARLLVAFVGVALFTAGLGAFDIVAMSHTNDNETLMYLDEFRGLKLFSEYAEQTFESRLEVTAYVLAQTAPKREALRLDIARRDVMINDLATQLDLADLDRAEVPAHARMTAAWAAFAQWRDTTVFGENAETSSEALSSAYEVDGMRFTDAFDQSMNAFREEKNQVAAELAASADATYAVNRTLAIVFSLAAIGVALTVGYFLSRAVSRAVGQASRAAAGLACGELDQQLEVRSGDELGRMADDFRRMISYQREMAGVATAIAGGDFRAEIVPKSPLDELGNAFQRMSRNLRRMTAEQTEHIQALAAQAQLLDLAHDAIIVRDHAGGQIRFWNRGAEELYGWSGSEAVGAVMHVLLETEFPESAEATTRELEREDRWNGQLRHMRRDGVRIRVDSRQVIQRDSTGKPIGVLAINTDVTRRHEAEVAMAQARDAAEAASRATSQFLANTSHEIRTPMNAILGMAELLAETPLTDEQREYVQTFQRAGDSLLSLINDLLDLSKVEAGQFELEHIGFDLGMLVEQAADVLAVQAHAKGLELTVHVLPDVPSHVLGDPARLRQVVTNLVGNAIKFTDQGEVSLRVERDIDRSESNAVSFSIRDTGIGIPMNKQATIFESFVQADASTTRRHGGTGLGLAISQRFVQLMGGNMRVVSQVGSGSTFTFSVPLEPISPPAEHVPTPAFDIHDWRVLVADDNATNRLILSQFLTERGAAVLEADDGLVALAAMRRASKEGKPFQLLLLDSRMPYLDGFQVAARLREEPSTVAEMVVMLTSDSRAGDVMRARQLGLAAYLVKPIKRAELMRVIAKTAHAAPPPVTTQGVAGSVSSDPEPAVRPLRLLLVEDSADNRLLIQSYLKKLPYAIDLAEDGQAGLAKVRQGTYDLVLMDMLMPVMDGLAATRAIRAWEHQEGRQPTPVVALTANAMVADVRNCLEAGCDAHVAKPIKKASLLAIIAHYAAAR